MAVGAWRGAARRRSTPSGRRWKEYENFAEELGHPTGDVALVQLLHQPAVTASIARPRTQDRLDSAVRALDLKMDADALARLNGIFPGKKTAP